MLDFVFLKVCRGGSAVAALLTMSWQREWAADKNTIAATFHRLKTRQLPFWLINHVEGTRITPSKLVASQAFSREKGLPVMNETLVPRVRGFVSTVQVHPCFALFFGIAVDCSYAACEQELRDAANVNLVLYDTTLMFTDSKTGATEHADGRPVGGPSLWSMMLGKPSATIHVHVRRYTMAQLPASDALLERWLVDAFVAKNALIAQFKATGKFPDVCPQPLQFPSMNIPA